MMVFNDGAVKFNDGVVMFPEGVFKEGVIYYLKL
jgi:hypothetical protein